MIVTQGWFVQTSSLIIVQLTNFWVLTKILLTKSRFVAVPVVHLVFVSTVAVVIQKTALAIHNLAIE